MLDNFVQGWGGLLDIYKTLFDNSYPPWWGFCNEHHNPNTFHRLFEAKYRNHCLYILNNLSPGIYPRLLISLHDLINNTINVPKLITAPTQDFHEIFPFDDAIFQDNLKKSYLLVPNFLTYYCMLRQRDRISCTPT